MRVQLVVGNLVVPLLVQTSRLRRMLHHRRPGSNETVMVATEGVPVCVCERAAGVAGAVVAMAAFSVATESAAAPLPLKKQPLPAAAAAAADAVAEVVEAEAGMVTSEALNGRGATHASRAWARPCKAASPAVAASPCEAPSLPKLRASRPCLHYRG